jgi:hypothetical protein
VVVFAEHQATVGDAVKGIKVMGGVHDGLAGVTESFDEVHQPVLGAGIQCGGGLVEQQYFRTHDQDRRNGDLFLLPA